MIATQFLVAPGLMFETFGRVAPLGLQLWDVAANAYAPNDLQVTATPLMSPTQTRTATSSRNGVYGFARLPGLPAQDYEGLGDDAYWAALTAAHKRRYRVTVTDPAQRFIPFSIEVDAPLRGLLAVNNASITVKRPTASLPLFSGVARATPAGVASVQVQVLAPWRVVQASLNNKTIATSISNANNEAQLFFAYPKMVLGKDLREQSWNIQLLVWHNPAGGVDVNGVPDLTHLLQAAQAVSIPGVTNTPHTLTFGQTLTIPNLKS